MFTLFRIDDDREILNGENEIDKKEGETTDRQTD